jgi:hypothetical protein
MYFIGLDLGQRHDPTAIAIVERMDTYHAHGVPKLHSLRVRHVERVPLGTPYPAVVERVRHLLKHHELTSNCALAVDATGVGAPVVDMLKAARLGCDVSPVNITSGDRQTRSGPTWNVPKQDLFAAVQVVLDRNQLKLARNLKELGTLIRELTDVRGITQISGRIRLGADGCGEHDDLVIALALACWRAQRPTNTFGTQRLPGI